MNKIFISVLSLILVCLASESRSDWGENAKAQINEFSENVRDGAVNATNNISRALHSLVERDNKNYWLNNIRSYKSFPINFYNGNGWKYDGNKEREEIATREHKHNVVVSANLGQRMIDSETFTVTVHHNSPRYVPEQKTTFYGVNSELVLTSDNELEPIGEVKMEGLYYLLFDPYQDGRIVMIDETGRFLHLVCRIYRDELVLPKRPNLVTPKNARVNKISGVKQTSEAPKFNFEIKYDGLRDDEMAFIYITSENGGQAQRFTYPASQKVINIYGNKIQIIKPYTDKIEYMILD